MFQAEAGSGNAASVRSTRDAISDTAASYAISNEEGARKIGSGQPAMNRSKQWRYGYKKHGRVTGHSSSRFRPFRSSAAAEEDLPDRDA
jgi:hypothetical protein